MASNRTYAVLNRVHNFLGILIRENLIKDHPFLADGELEDASSLADDVWDVLHSPKSDEGSNLRYILSLLDDEVWVRVRINDGREKDPASDLVLWSADWHGGGEDDPGMPEGLKDCLDWDADDISVEMYDDPEFRGIPGPEDRVPMLVVNVYKTAAKPVLPSTNGEC